MNELDRLDWEFFVERKRRRNEEAKRRVPRYVISIYFLVLITIIGIIGMAMSKSEYFTGKKKEVIAIQQPVETCHMGDGSPCPTGPLGGGGGGAW